MYDQFRNFNQARSYYRARRKEHHFILVADSPELAKTRCDHCGKFLNDFSGVDQYGEPLHPPGFDSNRCDYNPKDKSIRAYHYSCAWQGTLDKVATIRK